MHAQQTFLIEQAWLNKNIPSPLGPNPHDESIKDLEMLIRTYQTRGSSIIFCL